jgi:voltage-gated potassium channel
VLLRPALIGTVRVIGSVTGLLALYYLSPLDLGDGGSPVVLLLVALSGLGVLIGLQSWGIARAQLPGLRAVEALAATIPLLLISFATTYYSLSQADLASFTEPLNRTDALYFAVTVFATVGFGDITPVDQTARLVVTGQMAVNLLVIGVGLRVILGAVERGRSRRGAPAHGDDGR